MLRLREVKKLSRGEPVSGEVDTCLDLVIMCRVLSLPQVVDVLKMIFHSKSISYLPATWARGERGPALWDVQEALGQPVLGFHYVPSLTS